MSEVRSNKLQGNWASSAETTIPPSPTTGTAYRNTSAVVTGGFTFNEKSPSEVINQWLYTASLLLSELGSRGVLGWNSTTLYSVGAFAFGSDNSIYQCIQGTNTGKDPTTETAYWTKLDVLNRAKTDLSNITTVAMTNDNAVKTAPDVVTSYWVATDGLSYYRKWKSGFIEQGGSTGLITGNSYTTVTYPTAFTSKVFTVQCTRDNQSGGDATPGECVHARNIGLTTFLLGNSDSSSTATKGLWYACGF